MFTQLPNNFVDEHMRKLDAPAVLVYLVVCRQTVGWQKESDSISLSQFELVTGLSRPTVIRAIRALVQVNLVSVQTSVTNGIKASNVYSLTESKHALLRSNTDLLRGKADLPEPSNADLPPVVKQIDIQKKGLNKQERNTSASRQRDERIDLWQLTVYRELCRLHVPHALRDAVILGVSDETQWRAVILAWIGKGYRPNAISGMLEWYEKGIPDARRTQRQNNVRNTVSSLSPEEYVRAADTV
jgi:phage replication O-like protein O